jgi:cytochrome P450
VPLVSDLELPAFDYTDPELRGPRFHAKLAELAREGWLATTPLGFFTLDRDASTFFLRTKAAIFPGLKMAEMFEIQPGPLLEQIQRNILNVNGADHGRLRNLVNPAFTPRAADRWRPAMRGFLAQLFAQTDGGCEFVEVFAKPYPALTIATVMGAPLTDAPRLHHWSNWIQKQFDALSLYNERDLIEEAVVEFYEYAHALLDEKRSHPGEDLLSTLLAAEAEGDRLSDVECVNLVLNVLVGGVDTTQAQLSHAIRLFAEHPEQWEALRADPAGLAPAAVEEVVRYEPITPFTARILLEEVEHRDVTFPAGTIVLVCAHSANREIPDGDRFDITADRQNAKPLTFGAGIHYCLGANLAKAEMQEALEYLAPRMPDLRLDGEPEFGSITGIYGLDRLPVAWA